MKSLVHNLDIVKLRVIIKLLLTQAKIIDLKEDPNIGSVFGFILVSHFQNYLKRTSIKLSKGATISGWRNSA